MMEISNSRFGLIVAYVLPGFIALAGLAPVVPSVAGWLRPVGNGEFGIGPPLYAVLAATAVGLILSCIRWLTLDQIHARTGVVRPQWDDSQLSNALGGFDYLVQSHFRYYEFCGNTLVAVLIGYGLNRSLDTTPLLGVGTDVAIVLLCVVLFAASRDALAKYYTRTGRLIGRIAETEIGDFTMFNGNDHSASGSPAPRPTPKPEQKPSTPPKPEQASPGPSASQK